MQRQKSSAANDFPAIIAAPIAIYGVNGHSSFGKDRETYCTTPTSFLRQSV